MQFGSNILNVAIAKNNKTLAIIKMYCDKMGFGTIIGDIKAVKENDPAAKSYLEIILCHSPLHAVIAHRFSHKLYEWNIPIIPRFFSNIARFWSGVDIHPGAKIGKNFFLDHGVSTVIGETTEIGDNCVMFQGVTLGGTGKHVGKRHPTIGKNVFIGVNATLLGPINVGDNVKIGANTFVIMRDIPANCTVVGVPGKIVKENGKRVSKELPLSGSSKDETEPEWSI